VLIHGHGNDQTCRQLRCPVSWRQNTRWSEAMCRKQYTTLAVLMCLLQAFPGITTDCKKMFATINKRFCFNQCNKHFNITYFSLELCFITIIHNIYFTVITKYLTSITLHVSLLQRHLQRYNAYGSENLFWNYRPTYISADSKVSTFL
jgi:hypothetical protein